MRKGQRVAAGATRRDTGNSTVTKIIEESPLVKQAQKGDGEAFELLVRPHVCQAYRVARKITRNKEDAEDAAQQGLLKAFANIRQFHGEAHFSSWLYRIVMNEALMKVRKRQYEAGFVSMEPAVNEGTTSVVVQNAADSMHPECLYEKAEERRLLREGIDGLRSTSRAVIWLLGLQERQTREAASILCLSESAVKTRFLRARQQLRERLAPHFKDRQLRIRGMSGR